MVKCGTKLVPVTINIKNNNDFYSIISNGTKLVSVLIVSKYHNNSVAWSTVMPN